MWEEERIQREAGLQHGLLRLADLSQLGVTKREIIWRLRQGRVVAVHPGVYYIDSIPKTWKTMVLAAVMAAGPEAVASHRTAGVLWAFDAIYGRVIEVTVPYVESPEPTGVIIHRTRRPGSPAELGPIPITSPERTVFDLAPIQRGSWRRRPGPPFT
jgi:hypothetical protein